MTVLLEYICNIENGWACAERKYQRAHWACSSPLRTLDIHHCSYLATYIATSGLKA